MPIKSCNKRCGGCALRSGAEANLEPKNRIVAKLAVLGPFPFYCHANIDYSNTPHRMNRKEFIDRGMVLCTGWIEEVKDLAKTGYYKENRMPTKVFSKIAHENLELFLATEDPDEKEEAQRLLSKTLLMLAKKRGRFEPEASI